MFDAATRPDTARLIDTPEGIHPALSPTGPVVGILAAIVLPVLAG